MKQRQDKIPPPFRQVRLSEALQRLVRLYEATNQPDKAETWRKKLAEMKTANCLCENSKLSPYNGL